MMGGSIALIILIYVVLVAVVLLLTYVVVRFAVVHALESLPRRAERSRLSSAEYQQYLDMMKKPRN